MQTIRGDLMFIVLGLTEKIKSSKRIIQRYKSEEELRDIFKVDRLRRGRLLVFRVVNEPAKWYLISFDIKQVRKKGGGYRLPTKEYTVIKEAAFWNMCARVDNSTYICPPDGIEEVEGKIREYTDYIEVYPVEPHDEKTIEYVEEKLGDTIMYIITQVLAQAKKLEEKYHPRALEKALEMLKKLDKLLSRRRTSGLESARERLKASIELHKKE